MVRGCLGIRLPGSTVGSTGQTLHFSGTAWAMIWLRQEPLPDEPKDIWLPKFGRGPSTHVQRHLAPLRLRTKSSVWTKPR